MASQRDMNLSIAGIEVTIQTDEDRGYMLKLASMVDEKVTTYLKMGTRVTLAMAAVLAAMEFCDEYEKNKVAVENMRNQIRPYIDDAIKAANERDRVQAELDKLNKPVSYTHLDVYKRQVIHYAVLAHVSMCYPTLCGRLLTRYSPVRH